MPGCSSVKWVGLTTKTISRQCPQLAVHADSPCWSPAAQVIYPLDVATAVAREDAGRPESDAVSRAAALDARLDTLMGAVRLGYLVEREGGWGAAAEWGEVLSLGARSPLSALGNADRVTPSAPLPGHPVPAKEYSMGIRCQVHLVPL